MNKYSMIFTCCFVVLLMTTNQALGQVEIVNYSIDGGAGISTGGDFSVAGTVGQHDAGAESSGGNFTVTGGFETEDDILLGDVNGDGEVNLLDVGPFVDAISSGTYIAEADINQDGSVNLLDVGPFIDILSG